MGYRHAKVYSDGNHYIAIPQDDTACTKRRKRPKEEPPKKLKACRGDESQATLTDKTANGKAAEPTPEAEFDRLYKEYAGSPKKERKQRITEAVTPFFEDTAQAEAFVIQYIERQERNRICRMVRLLRKARLQQWTHFCTFTYDSKKLDEEAFRKKLQNTLRHLSSRNGWKYIGVWERSPTHQRLHFHALVYVPQDGMVGEIVECRDFDTRSKRMQTTYQNSHFEKQFGRNDFKAITPHDLQDSLAYLIKYIDKSGERIVYSRGLATYFEADIMDEDVICTYGVDDRKLILADNFSCISNGEYIGEVSPEVIAKMPKCN